MIALRVDFITNLYKPRFDIQRIENLSFKWFELKQEFSQKGEKDYDMFKRNKSKYVLIDL